MYHSVIFGDLKKVEENGKKTTRFVGKNTYKDFHLIPSTRALFAPPEVKTNYVELPGSDGSLDMSTSLTGYPLYNNREGSMEFYVENDHDEWYNIYSDISDFLHGQHMKAVLEDDPNYYYEGRFSINEWNSSERWSKVVINYIVAPYKMSIASTTDDWEWNPFSFKNGVINNSIFRNIPIDTDEWVGTLKNQNNLLYTCRDVGRKPVSPVISTSGGPITLLVFNDELGIQNRVVELPENYVGARPELVLSGIYGDDGIYEYNNRILCKGHGTISLDFRKGRL